jgi:Flp pilus assembly protein TadG
VTNWHQLSTWRTAQRAWRDERAAQIVEFAVALPLLVLFVVGIFDFSAAYTLKQKLTNLARDTARVAAADPANDLSNPLPASISDAFWVVDNYLAANKINDCGITTSGVTPTGQIWTFSKASNGCTGTGLVVTINRGYYFPAATTVVPADLNCTPQATATNQIAVISTCVSIQYAYQWRFGRAIALLGSTISLPTTITATAVAMNEN